MRDVSGDARDAGAEPDVQGASGAKENMTLIAQSWLDCELASRPTACCLSALTCHRAHFMWPRCWRSMSSGSLQRCSSSDLIRLE